MQIDANVGSVRLLWDLYFKKLNSLEIYAIKCMLAATTHNRTCSDKRDVLLEMNFNAGRSALRTKYLGWDSIRTDLFSMLAPVTTGWHYELVSPLDREVMRTSTRMKVDKLFPMGGTRLMISNGAPQAFSVCTTNRGLGTVEQYLRTLKRVTGRAPTENSSALEV